MRLLFYLNSFFTKRLCTFSFFMCLLISIVDYVSGVEKLFILRYLKIILEGNSGGWGCWHGVAFSSNSVGFFYDFETNRAIEQFFGYWKVFNWNGILKERLWFYQKLTQAFFIYYRTFNTHNLVCTLYTCQLLTSFVQLRRTFVQSSIQPGSILVCNL